MSAEEIRIKLQIVNAVKAGKIDVKTANSLAHTLAQDPSPDAEADGVKFDWGKILQTAVEGGIDVGSKLATNALNANQEQQRQAQLPAPSWFSENKTLVIGGAVAVFALFGLALFRRR